MKTLLYLSFFSFNLLAYSQEPAHFKVEKVRSESDFYPQIEGVFEGEINIANLGSSNGFITAVGWEITSFEISFPYGSDYKSYQIESNVIPEEIIKEIVKGALRENVFITKIMAEDEEGVSHLLKSMQLIPIVNEN